jgi:hypothetical protein
VHQQVLQDNSSRHSRTPAFEICLTLQALLSPAALPTRNQFLQTNTVLLAEQVAEQVAELIKGMKSAFESSW